MTTRPNEINVTPSPPRTGFIQKYIEYHKARTDAPRDYAEILAIKLLGMAIGRDSTNALSPDVIYHNIYLLLLGESGESRKSTAMKIQRQVNAGIIYTLPKKWTPEALLDALRENPEGIIPIDEFSKFLKTSGRKGHYMAGAQELLDELFDCPETYDYITKKSGEIRIEQPYVGVLAATTPESLKNSIEPEDLNTGFINRFFISDKTRMVFKPRGYAAIDLEATRRELHSDLEWVKNNRPYHFRFNESALVKLNLLFDEMRKEFSGKVKGGFLSRAEDYLIKIADIFALDRVLACTQHSLHSLTSLDSQDSHKIEVTVEDLDKAYPIVHCELMGIVRICEFCEYERPVMIVKEEVRKHGPIDRSQLMRNSHLSARIFKEALDTLTQSGQVKLDVKTNTYTLSEVAGTPDSFNPR
jgi:hypothetical protein